MSIVVNLRYTGINGNAVKFAQEIIAGTAESTTAEWFGMKIRLFKFLYAGFLCDL